MNKHKKHAKLRRTFRFKKLCPECGRHDICRAKCSHNTNQRLLMRHHAFRLETLRRYGNKCACCGEKEASFLAVDHVYGNGAKERKKWGTTGFFRHLARAPKIYKKYQLLCHNCNQSKGYYGKCAHKL